MKRQQALTVEGAVELPHVIGYLEALVQALKSGAAKVQRGDEQVVLGPRGVVGFSLAAVDKGKRQKLSLTLSWRKYAAPDEALDLSIGPAEGLAEVATTIAAEVEDEEVAPMTSPEVTPAVGPEATSGPGEVVLGEAD